MIIKVIELPKKYPKFKLPNNIHKHCDTYTELSNRQISKFAWSLLGKYINLTKVKFNDNGKPSLSSGNKYFSLSHSLNMIAIVVDNKPVGIDIETLLPSTIARTLAKRLLKGKELKQYMDAKDREIWFTKYWTQHEAYMKLLGNKLTLESFRKPLNCQTSTKKIKDESKRIYLMTIATKK